MPTSSHSTLQEWRQHRSYTPMADELDDYKNDDNDGIIAVGDIPEQPSHAPLLVKDTDNNNTAGSE